MSVAIRDLNGDGRLDLLYACHEISGSNWISAYLQGRDGKLAPVSWLPLPVIDAWTPSALGDLNGDGAMDMASPDKQYGSTTLKIYMQR